jgi:hypothetical protein
MSSIEKSDPSSGAVRAGASRRKASTGFPVVSLPDAAKIIRDAGKYGFEHSVSAFARYMGHSTTNSGAFRQRLASFRDWKLIAGRGDTVVFTDTAKTIALPPDPAAERDALQTAFMNCAVFAALYERVAKGETLDAQRLGAIAVHELGVSPSSVERFTTSFIASAVAAGLAEAEGSQVVLLEPDNDEDRRRRGADEVDVDEAGSASHPRARPIQAPPVVHQEWTLPGGAVIFEVRLDRPLPATAFQQLGSVVQQAEVLANQLRDVVADERGAW